MTCKQCGGYSGIGHDLCHGCWAFLTDKAETIEKEVKEDGN